MPAYEYADAKALLIWILARWDKVYIPQPALDALLQPAPQPSERPDKKIECANDQCLTKSTQTHTQGNRGCIDYFCSSCCRNARA